ncbi:MAG: hypothetical protein A3B74_04600 [Candidatus Kerfeldbacteria bacterium RIFCSPHIGHO2_02_FULL_42_14]|uniref:CopG family transcriptional regulator n=1 Tax=Candidatus Kerfeldbacteria bacterium RIFCSPHIGHO2_02_FULL_42_14 TaxID=1798540 RepID=A0A1G2APZ6_9BACT|nr:MAG: hypothetical protein A3B74_04600 [Candidatus Kerfeldbacteria bacterium RIFCSPHIGHO2_02_FULL_42_14]OGY81006.1 MAG: hypothetical protein A3E60_03320 [Candidatus Kerfeldbacteria bacterium RIFCSPHIGHO2_12_FULL_42_13]OGY84960.1 MAG: hypothetical protein A3I91_00555 [Candidatus Kerfeldbacteria bacterium RIFCSPLOWO2_02_FULL_42_19]OGY86127.1 MAG: hypothetical protein A3G01_02085 [Candidatus Kerfeldbacteria bacterium RIFCSPLOWO2_12_FULL_43_9]
MNTKQRYGLSAVVLIGLLVAAGFFLSDRSGADNPQTPSKLAGVKGVLYKSLTCGCCENYVKYLQKKGMQIEVKNQTKDSDLAAIKNQYNIPPEEQSCHTLKVGDYFVEGHVPAEVIEKLVTEKSAIAGIALPDMPAGSPGMPGKKQGAFKIDQLSKDNQWSTYTEW